MKEKSCFSYKFVNDVCVVGGVQEPDDEDDGEPFFSADVKGDHSCYSEDYSPSISSVGW